MHKRMQEKSKKERIIEHLEYTAWKLQKDEENGKTYTPYISI